MDYFRGLVAGASIVAGYNAPELEKIENPVIPIVSDCSEKQVPMIVFFKSYLHGTLKTNPEGAGFIGLHQDIKICKDLSLARHCDGGEDIVIAPYMDLYTEIIKRKKTDRRDLFVTPLASLTYVTDLTRMRVKNYEKNDNDFKINETKCTKYTKQYGYLRGYHVGKFSDDTNLDYSNYYLKFSPSTSAVLKMLHDEIVDN
jgi:hypothetical protein